MSFLSKEYHHSHDFAFFLHDILVRYIKIGEKQGWFTSQFKFLSPQHGNGMNEIEVEECWEWLKENGYSEVLNDVKYRMVIIGALSDFCHFIYEGLSCSKKGKLAVAFSLFRKPLKDNLFIFEWLLADPKDFLVKFQQESENFAPDRINPEKKIEIIQKALKKLSMPETFDDQLIYDIRYNKHAEYGFEGLWNGATHLVTTFKTYKTDNDNFNFLFSQDDDRLVQWDTIYLLIPYVLFYATEIIEELITSLVKIPKEILEINKIRRQIRFLIWTQSCGNDVNEFLNSIKDELKFTCPHCRSSTETKGRFLKDSIGSFARKKAQLTPPGCQLSHKTIYAQNF